MSGQRLNGSFVDTWIAEREEAQSLAEAREVERLRIERAYQTARTGREKRDALAELATADWLKEHGETDTTAQ